MPEAKLIREFKCPKCSSWWSRFFRWLLRKPLEGTVTGLALQPLMEKGKVPKDTSYALRRELVPLLQPPQVTLTSPVLVVSWDICAKCGTLHPVRAEVVEAPITMQPAGGKGGSPFGSQGQKPRGFAR